MKIGDPLNRSTDHGPQNHRAHLEKLIKYCEIGIQQGATLVCGGKQVDMPGILKDSPATVCVKNLANFSFNEHKIIERERGDLAMIAI